MTASEREICQEIRKICSDIYKDEAELPQPYCVNRADVKAIVLGTDPSNREGKTFNRVFGLQNESLRYFGRIKRNLDCIGLTLKDIYVQNFCKNYFTQVTTDNGCWVEAAKIWRDFIREELDYLNPQRDIPVLITAHILVGVIVNPDSPVRKVDAEYWYEKGEFIHHSDNFLGRTVIPFFRHAKYNLNSKKYPLYITQIRSQLRRGPAHNRDNQ
ncbi:MAG: hypothetical protein IT324_32340 [Anaerolineae bacterium]|nr:hypothetical protein [Anaerolineae bacterium]